MENNTLTIGGKAWKMPLRVLTLITFFIAAYTLVQSVLVLIQDYERQDLSMLVVVIFLLVTPLAFATALLFAYSVHKIAGGAQAGKQIVLGYAVMVLAAVDNLIYISIHHEGDSVSFYLLGGIELVCFILFFLYYQDLGNRAMALCAGVLLVACTVLELEEAIRYFISVSYYDFTGYYFCQTLLDALIAVESLLFLLGLKKQEGIDKK